MTEDDAMAAAEKRAKAEAELRKAIGKAKTERTTATGKACIEAAQKLVDLGELVEARHWVKLSIDADKASADVKLQKALDKIEAKGANGDKFDRVRRGSKGSQAEG